MGFAEIFVKGFNLTYHNRDLMVNNKVSLSW